jgi:DNA repair protein RadA/Sms
MKISTIYICGNCSYQSSKWQGRCPECEAWNSFAEEQVQKGAGAKKGVQGHAREPKEFENIMKNLAKETRFETGIGELDRVIGGGIVPGSMTLLTGEPGIGKSTLTLQIADKLCAAGKSVLYISGEESEAQIGIRGARLGLKLKNLKLLSESNLETILATATEQKSEFLIIDSIQVISSQNIPGGAGSVSQVRLCTETILEFAKPKHLSVLLIGHVTKDGTLAGPRVLEHLVDTVLYIEGSRTTDFRILRGVKNRYGGTSEVGIFEMNSDGLNEIKNPAEFFIKDRHEGAAGSVLAITSEGNRPIFLEVQALTNATVFGYPVRRASGFDTNRLQLLIAVMQKHLSANLGNQDVYVNVVSGYKLNDPAADLGICLAILSSFYKKPIPKNIVAIGELGLSGEIRYPKEMAKKTKEIAKMGLKCIEQSASLAKIARDLF